MSALMIGIAGAELAASEARLLNDPAVAGVILFSRNFVERRQLRELTAAIRAAAPQVLIAVDHEGGRVQRFRTGYSALPPLCAIGRRRRHDPAAARRAARLHATLVATEVMADGLDLSLAPVVDLGRGNLAIGDRAFDADPQVCAELGAIYVDALQRAGMAATIKHFPGHGSVIADTHTDRAIDDRPVRQILDEDLLPFAVAIAAGARAVMMGHVEYPRAAPEAAGYSPYWIREVLRRGLGFRGVVVSDDIGMTAGAQAGTVHERLARHAQAGCDLVLACAPELAAPAVEAARRLGWQGAASVTRKLRGRPRAALLRARERSTWAKELARLAALLEGSL
jgi:beta-N-acetylhexosaminidase